MIYAMSDIHGCIDELKEKMELVDLSGGNRLLLLGDYIDYGRSSGHVLKFIYDLQKEYGPEKIIVLMGNHESMFLEWISQFENRVPGRRESLPFDSWLKTDSEQGYIAFRSMVGEDSMKDFLTFEKKASFDEINRHAVRMLYDAAGDQILWLKGLKKYHETDKQIFVHAGIDEEAEEYWEVGTSDDIFLWKFPAQKGRFYKDIVAGHIGTASLEGNINFHDIFYDGESHYYIDGSVYNNGKLLLLAYDEKCDKYYQVEKIGSQTTLLSLPDRA